MKNFIYLFVSFVLFPTTHIQAQNLVPNPSFEYYEGELATGIVNGGLHNAMPWFRVPWGEGNSDLVHVDMPLSSLYGDYVINPASSGKAYGRIVVTSFSNPNYYYTESIEVRFEQPLQVGEVYQVSYYIQKAKFVPGDCVIGSDELGLYFYTDTIYQKAGSDLFDDPYKLENYIELVTPYVSQSGNQYYEFAEYLLEPRIELGQVIDNDQEWVLITDTIHANKPYEFMAFSRFNLWEDITFAPEDTTCGYATTYSLLHIDDVSVHLVDEPHIAADAGVDTTICMGDSIQLGTTEYDDYMYWWSPNEGMPLNIYGHTNPGMPWITPTQSQTYTLTQKDFAFVETTDQVTVNLEICPDFDISEFLREQTKVYPNPAKDFIEIESGYAIASWKLIDAVGNEVSSSKDLVSSKNLHLDISPFKAGIYFLELEVGGAMVVKQVLIE